MANFLKKSLFIILEIAPIVILAIYYGFKVGIITGFLVSLIILVKYILHYEEELFLYIYRARPPMSGELPVVSKITELLTSRKGVLMPSIFFTDMPLPGSFIIGKSPVNTRLVIPVRVINFLKDVELETMIAYNIAQIGPEIHRRTRIALIGSLLSMAGSFARSGAVLVGFGDLDDPMPRSIGKFVKGLVSPPAATLILLISGKNYDQEAFSVYNNTDIMSSTINKLEENNVVANPAIGVLSIIDPKREDFFDELFVTHLRNELRMNRLYQEVKLNGITF